MNPLEQALDKVRAGREAEALADLADLAHDAQWGGEARGHRAWLLRSLGRWAEARSEYESLLRADPDNLDAVAQLADVLILGGDPEAGVARLGGVLAKQPGHVGALEVMRRHLLTSEAAGPDRGVRGRVDDLDVASDINLVAGALNDDQGQAAISISPAAGRLLYGLVRCLRPNLIIETGTYIGYSALYLAQGLRDNGQGRLACFDLFLDQPGYQSPVAGACQDLGEVSRLHLDRAGLSSYMEFHRGDSAGGIEAELLENGARAQMAFIDGDHRIKGCLRDWNAVDRLMDENGIVVLHDSDAVQAGWLGPRYLMEKLRAQSFDDYAALDLPTPKGVGMAVIQKQCGAGARVDGPTLAERIAEIVFHRVRGKKMVSRMRDRSGGG